MSSALACTTENSRPQITSRRTQDFFMRNPPPGMIETGLILHEVGKSRAHEILRHLLAPQEREVGVVHGPGRSRGGRCAAIPEGRGSSVAAFDRVTSAVSLRAAVIRHPERLSS